MAPLKKSNLKMKPIIGLSRQNRISRLDWISTTPPVRDPTNREQDTIDFTLIAYYDFLLTGRQCPPINVYSVDLPDECCVCYESIEHRDRRECGHYVHRECIAKSYSINNDCRCPYCRQNLPTFNYV